MLLELRDEGSTIILATNELYEADQLSDRVAILHKGKLLVCDTPKKLKDSIVGGDIMDIQLEKDAPPKLVEELKGMKEVVDLMQVKPTSIRLYLNRIEEGDLRDEPDGSHDYEELILEEEADISLNHEEKLVRSLVTPCLFAPLRLLSQCSVRTRRRGLAHSCARMLLALLFLRIGS